MAFVLEDRVVETANNPGQGDFELLGATDNNRSFVTGIGDGNTTRYLAIGAEGWEIGVAQVSAGSPDRLLRPGTVTKNSDGTTTPVNFTGTVTVACIASVEDVFNAALLTSGTLPAGRLSGNYSFGSLTLSGSLTVAGVTTTQGPIVADADSGGNRVEIGGSADILDSSSRTTIRGRQGNSTWYININNLPNGWEWRTHDNGDDFNNAASLTADGNLTVAGTITAQGDPVATVSTRGTHTVTEFPIGHNIIVYTAGNSYVRNNVGTVRLDAAIERYRIGGSGDVLAGTWRARGYAYGTENNVHMFQRVA